MPMRVATILLSVLLAGCQGSSTLDRWIAQPVPSVMPFWETYQRCMATTDADVLVQSLEQLERAQLEGSEPPDWIKIWGDHVVRQPLRTAVDPRALSAACTIRTASVMADRERLVDAKALYQRVVARYPDRDLTYYVEQAKGGLAALPPFDSALLARR
jgi:hypothetical protein